VGTGAQVLEGTPAGKEEVGQKLVGDIQEGLRRLRGVIDQQDPGKVSFRCGLGLLSSWSQTAL
jgi:hypothetical protein